MLEIKVLNDEQKEQTLKVVTKTTINSSAILALDEQLNDEPKINVVNNAIDIINEQKLLTTFKNKVVKMSKRNTKIDYEYDEIKDDIFKIIDKKTFDEINDEIDEKLMLLEITDEKVKTVYNCYDFWYTHNEQKLEKMISNYNKLQKYKELYEKNVGKK